MGGAPECGADADPASLQRAIECHAWDAMAPAALEAIQRRGPFRYSAETGCGGSTILLSHAFAIEGENRSVTHLAQHPDLRRERVEFREGESKRTRQGHEFAGPLDFILRDGPHAYPLPQLEYVYLFPQLRKGGWIALDDLEIPSVYELYRFLTRDCLAEEEEVVVRTALLQKTGDAGTGPDGWNGQAMNRRRKLRYAWRDMLRERLGRTEAREPLQ